MPSPTTISTIPSKQLILVQPPTNAPGLQTSENKFDSNLMLPIIATSVLTILGNSVLQYFIHILSQNRNVDKIVQDGNTKYAEGAAMLTLAEIIEKLATKEDLKDFATKEDLRKVENKVDKILNLLQSLPITGPTLRN